MTRPSALVTIAELAMEFDVPRHKVEYLIRARGLRPASRAGNTRLFSQTDAERLRSELARRKLSKNGGAA